MSQGLLGGIPQTMSDLIQSLSHARWDCKYHIVFVPKRRRKAFFGKIRNVLGGVFHALAKQKECQILYLRMNSSSNPTVDNS